MSSIDDDALLVTVFDSGTTVGLVKFYSGRAIKRIRLVLEGMRSNTFSTALFTNDDVNRATGVDMFQR